MTISGNQTLTSMKPPRTSTRYHKNADYYNKYAGMNDKLLPAIKSRSKGSSQNRKFLRMNPQTGGVFNSMAQFDTRGNGKVLTGETLKQQANCDSTMGGSNAVRHSQDYLSGEDTQKLQKDLNRINKEEGEIDKRPSTQGNAVSKRSSQPYEKQTLA